MRYYVSVHTELLLIFLKFSVSDSFVHGNITVFVSFFLFHIFFMQIAERQRKLFSKMPTKAKRPNRILNANIRNPISSASSDTQHEEEEGDENGNNNNNKNCWEDDT